MRKPRISVIVADDHPVVLRGIVDVLKSGNMDVVGAFDDGVAAMDAIRKLAPDVAVLDLAMPGLNGLEILATMAAEKCDTKTVLLTASIADGQILTALERGVKAILLKDTAPDHLVTSVRAVSEGGKWFPADMIDAALERETGRVVRSEHINRTLTAREREIMLLVAQGLSNKRVAKRLAVSEGTVKIHLHNMYQKIGVPNRTALTVFALAHAAELTQ
jgi:DNA-binding NarL/FixJ family response regulator